MTISGVLQGAKILKRIKHINSLSVRTDEVYIEYTTYQTDLLISWFHFYFHDYGHGRVTLKLQIYT